MVSAGYGHTCALKTDGSIACWGDNTYGQTSVPTPADSTAPTTTLKLAPASPNGSGGWYTSSVGVSVSASDPDDSVPQTRCVLDPMTTPASFSDLPASCSLSSVTADGPHTIYAASIDSNGNMETPVSVSFKIDRTPPIASVQGVTNGTSYLLGAVPQASCQTTDPGAGATPPTGSGVATAASLSLSGGTANGVGAFTASCSGAIDNAGNHGTTASASYQVNYAFSGYLEPVNNPDTVNTGAAARTYPIKWQLQDASGRYISALTAVTSVTYKSTSCSAFGTDPTDPLGAVTTGGTSLRYDSTANQYVYNWATPKTKGCYTLFLTLDSGQVFPAYFNFK